MAQVEDAEPAQQAHGGGDLAQQAVLQLQGLQHVLQPLEGVHRHRPERVVAQHQCRRCHVGEGGRPDVGEVVVGEVQEGVAGTWEEEGSFWCCCCGFLLLLLWLFLLLLFLLLLCFVLFLGNRGAIPGTEQLEALKKTFFWFYLISYAVFFFFFFFFLLVFVLFCFAFVFVTVLFFGTRERLYMQQSKGRPVFLSLFHFVCFFVCFVPFLLILFLLLLKNVLYKNQREIG